MLKETIRQLASSKEKMSMVMGGQLQLAGVSAEEQKALLSELNKRDNGVSRYDYGWN
ncbi:competence pheromone ComX [Paenibacillus sp. J5C_2022]|uniref:competence pheromone ComX n=1 Tax=Paenibacillus sp. J5C2022 TaxID=2977129 RepID=UPI0021D32560|nr:competence pheromone ComX [Paenibacillus sp. J5C2022]MCU6711831.1 competence pheromone ComX [Paenibacillus sp. J5C2022]